MNYYVKINHPITGGTILGVCTGKTRTTEREGTLVVEAEAIIITPGSNLSRYWITKADLTIHSC